MCNTQDSRRTYPISLIIDNGDPLANARRLALEEAGLDEDSVVFTHTGETTFLGRKIYEVMFTGSELHYEYDIDAETWEIVGQDFAPVSI